MRWESSWPNIQGFQGKADLPWVSRGPKARSEDVADGQQVEIPVLQYDRTVGTRVESIAAEWKAAGKRGRSHIGKTVWQSKGVMRSELK